MISQIARLVESGARVKAKFQEQGIESGHQLADLFLRITQEILGFPRHLSQHVGGFVISRGPISQLVPLKTRACPIAPSFNGTKKTLKPWGY